VSDSAARPVFLDMTAYQWTVLFAAWLGWGFDCFDALLFNFVAPTCVPALLGLEMGTPAAKSATLYWTGVSTSILLVGWAIGGIVFARVADRIGRARTLLLTMLLYALATAACAAAPNLWVLLAVRFVAALGIGGEWAAGAALVAEIVPEKRRLEAGALLYTAAPMGLFLATFATWWIQGVLLVGQPEVAWRYVFLCGLVPAAVAMFVRVLVKEPERWKAVADDVPRMAEIFGPALRGRTLSGLAMALVALLMWWSCNAFIPVVAAGLAVASGNAPEVESWKALATNSFNIGGLIGTLLTVPIARSMGRRAMFGLYFVGSAVAIAAAFGLPMDPHTRLYMYFPIGLTVFGVFGSFTYYLPELFPTRLRGTGAGFCYNAGRILTAGGPLLVGSIAARGADALASAMAVLFWVSIIPVVGLLLLPLVVETKGQALAD